MFLVGEGPELPKVYQMVQQCNIGHQVVFLGKQDDVSRLHSLADVFLLPSQKESFGLVALEAMACGVPVVASNTGGLPELVKHGETGFLAEIGDVDQMAAYVVQIFQESELFGQLSRASMQRVHDYFSAEVIANQYEELYYRAVSDLANKF